MTAVRTPLATTIPPPDRSAAQIRNARYRQRHHDELLARKRAWASAHRDQAKQYYQGHRGEIIDRVRKWREQYPERCLDKAKLWYREHRERALKNVKSWQSGHPEEVKAFKRASYRRRMATPKGRALILMGAHKRRALLVKATVNLRSITDWMERVRSKPTARCYYCQQRIASSTIHFDHIVALSRGGPHSVENLCVSCSRCNRRKWNKPIRAWVKMGQQILEL